MYDAAEMRYDLYMSHALSEAAGAVARGGRPDGAVIVIDDAMVASASDQVASSGDPTAHAIIVALREAAARMGQASLSGATVFSVVEPCTMCLGALLQADADGIVFALPDAVAGACGAVLRAAAGAGGANRLRVVSGILQEEARELGPDAVRAQAAAARGSSATR